MRIERRILLGRMETGTGGWDDPANKAYYEELRRQQRELDAKLVQTLLEARQLGRIAGRSTGPYPAHLRNLRRLLRPRRKWPRSRSTAEQSDESAPSHSITSSARASTLAGISMPNAFAVLRLITSSYLVGACTGRSAGLSPLRMRSM